MLYMLINILLKKGKRIMINFAAVLEDEQIKDNDVTVIESLNALSEIASTKELLKKTYNPILTEILMEVHNINVTDDMSEKKAIDIGVKSKNFIKKIEDKRKEIIKEPDTFVREVNSFCKGFKDQLDEIISTLKGKISQHQYKKELERRKKEEEMRKAQEELKKKIEEEASKYNIEVPVMNLPEPVIKKTTITRTESGSSAHLKNIWDFELVDLSKVPINYLCLDEKKIKAAINSGIRNIAGLNIFEKPTTIFR